MSNTRLMSKFEKEDETSSTVRVMVKIFLYYFLLLTLIKSCDS